jgi:hypothetical protein
MERRIQRLERAVHAGPDNDRAYAVMRAYELVKSHPEQATEIDRALAVEWPHAFCIVLEAEGGLAAVVQRVAANMASTRVARTDGMGRPTP